MISSMSVYICNYIYARQAKKGMNNHFLEGYPSLIPACATLLERKRFGLGLIKSTFNAENFICRLFWFISSHFGAIHLEMCVAAQNREKFTETPYSAGSKLLK